MGGLRIAATAMAVSLDRELFLLNRRNLCDFRCRAARGRGELRYALEVFVDLSFGMEIFIDRGLRSAPVSPVDNRV